MPAILTSIMSTVAAKQFLDSIISNSQPMYQAIGNSTPWDIEFQPPAPENSIEYEKYVRDNLIGYIRVYGTEISLMVPRVQWAPGMTFEPIDESAENALRATNYFCINRLNYVYKCIGKDAIATTTMEGGEPELMGKNIRTSDGYIWEFLYDIQQTTIDNGLLLEDWMPVNYNTNNVYPGGSLSPNQKDFGDVNAASTLGAHRVMISTKITSEMTHIPSDNTSYRQFVLIASPLNPSGVPLSNLDYAVEDVDTNSGDMIFIDNRKPIYRSPDQSEQFYSLLTF